MINAICTRLNDMVKAYTDNVTEKQEQIRSMEADLAKARAEAAAAENIGEYQAARDRASFLEARIKAANNQAVAPLFATAEEALQLQKEYNASVQEYCRPIYARLLETMAEQKALYKQLEAAGEALHFPVENVAQHASKVNVSMHAWYPHRMLKEHFADTDHIVAMLKE